MHILSYVSGDNRRSMLHGVPIEYLGEIRRLCAIDGTKVKVRYRGPRKHRSDRFNARSYCLKGDAVTFAVYRR